MLQLHILIFLILSVPAIIFITVFIARPSFRFEKRGSELSIIKVAFLFASVVSMLLLIVFTAPFNPKYWTITNYSGEVRSVERLAADVSDDGTTLTSSFVVEFDGLDEPVITDDPRVLTYEQGDNIDLACTVEFIYGGKDKINCVVNS
jgi:hypothetical protein